MKTFAPLALTVSLLAQMAHTLVAHAYEIVPVEGAAVIQGTVRLKGQAPAPKEMLITKDNDVCGSGSRQTTIVRANGGALEGAVVYLEKVEKGKSWETPAEGYLLDQKGCRFLPPLLVIPKGETLNVRNSDPVLHNIHTYEVMASTKRTMFNLGQPEQNSVIQRAVSVRRSPFVKVECDAHDFMEGWIFAPANPYYSATDASGKFAIREVPPGSYTLKAWHPVLGETAVPVSVETGRSISKDLELGTAP